MLKKNSSARGSARGLRFAIVASRYNARYVNGMLRAAEKSLRAAGADAVEVIRVPGSYEIPVAAAALARRADARPDAILCLGLIWQGQTLHAEHIGGAITDALMALQVESGVPCVHEVLVVKTAEHARERCLDPETNRGTEAAQTAVAMGRLLRKLAR